MSFVRLNQAPVSPTPATSVLKEKARGKDFCFLTEFIISAVFPIFFYHFSISHFPFLTQITAINHAHVLKEVRECSRDREKERGGSSLMEPSPAPGFISQTVYVVCTYVLVECVYQYEAI